MPIVFTKTFKGYEDRTNEIDVALNEWMVANKGQIQEVVSVKTVLAHETNSRAKSGDLIYTVVYLAEQPIL